MTENNQLTKKLRNKIDDICEQGDLAIIDFFDYDTAIEKYKEALELVPEPIEEYATTTWIYVAIGDAYYLNDNFDNAMEYFQKAVTLIDGESAFTLLRIGQCHQKNDDIEQAKDFLQRAYKLGGDETFVEYDDALELIRDLI